MATKKAQESRSEVEWPFGKKNYLLFGLALIVIAIGYVTLSQGSMTLSPILLVVGYCVLIPLAILIKDHPSESASDTAETAEDD